MIEATAAADARPHLRELFPEDLLRLPGAGDLTLTHARRIFSHAVGKGRDDLEVLHPLARRISRAVLAATRQDPIEEVSRERASDGFVKFGFRLGDGAVIETVLIPLTGEKFSICISSQVGCALACAFCATGLMGAGRNLEPWEMVEQVVRVRAVAPGRVSGAVFQGMGEPFLNYDAVIRAARLLSHPSMGAISGKAITISTAGLVPQIERYTREGHPYRLSVSLSAARPDVRRRIMPIENTWPLPRLMEAVRAHQKARGGRINLAYVMIAGVNTGPEDAEALGRLLEGLPTRLNLIAMNPIGNGMDRPRRGELAEFLERVRALGIPVVRRYSGGEEVNGACGMLGLSQLRSAADSIPQSPALPPSRP